MKKYRPFIVLFAVLILPLLVYVFMKYTVKQNYRPIEIISEKVPNPDGSLDSVYLPVGNFAFVSQLGDTLTLDSLKDNVWVVNIFHTNCLESCDIAHDYIKQMLQKDFVDDSRVRFLSFSVDPANDSIPLLKVYADRMGATAHRWYFLSGNPEAMKKYLTQELRYPEIDQKTIASGSAGDMSFRLIDWNGYFRGSFYNASVEAEMVTLAQHIVFLLKELDEIQSKNAGNHP
jgi:protein SCO1